MDQHENYYVVPYHGTDFENYNLLVNSDGPALLIRTSEAPLIIEMQRPGLVLACQEHLPRKAEKIGYDGMHKERVRIQTRVQKADHVNAQDIKKERTRGSNPVPVLLHIVCLLRIRSFVLPVVLVLPYSNGSRFLTAFPSKIAIVILIRSNGIKGNTHAVSAYMMADCVCTTNQTVPNRYATSVPSTMPRHVGIALR